LDAEKLARKDLKRRLQQLQADMAAKENVGPEKEDNPATAALTEKLKNLRLRMNQQDRSRMQPPQAAAANSQPHQAGKVLTGRH
jgi:LPS O-antigen subunit length determinant protein (WzzB/FepE family)